MKKVIIMLVMLFTMNVVMFAEDNNMSNVEAIEKYDLKLNFGKLSSFLQLNSDQMDAVEAVENEFQNDLMFAATECLNDSRKAVTKNAVDKHVRHVRYILNDEQYHKYLIVLNATINNRNLLK